MDDEAKVATATAAFTNTKLSQELYDWIEIIVYSLSVVLLIFMFLFRQVSVGGISMENTLNAGVINEDQFIDRVLVYECNYVPRRGDIVVLTTKAVKTSIIKRVIAVGGDTVDINFDKHTVSVNGKVLNEPYIKEPTASRGDVKFPVTVPKGDVFVMGDNRNVALDSRYAAIGMVNNNNIMGKAILRFFPLNEIKILR